MAHPETTHPPNETHAKKTESYTDTYDATYEHKYTTISNVAHDEYNIS